MSGGLFRENRQIRQTHGEALQYDGFGIFVRVADRALSGLRRAWLSQE